MSNQAGAFYMFMKHVQRELREEGLQIDRIQELLPIAEPRWQVNFDCLAIAICKAKSTNKIVPKRFCCLEIVNMANCF